MPKSSLNPWPVAAGRAPLAKELGKCRVCAQGGRTTTWAAVRAVGRARGLAAVAGVRAPGGRFLYRFALPAYLGIGDHERKTVVTCRS